eukprot:3532598-Rhodomonas_salina.1
MALTRAVHTAVLSLYHKTIPGLGAWYLGLKAEGLGLKAQNLGLTAHGSAYTAQAIGSMEGLGSRVHQGLLGSRI